MAPANPALLVAVDVGNGRIKLGEFALPLGDRLPHPAHAHALELDYSDDELAAWLPRPATDYAWLISSVNHPLANRLVEWLQGHGVRQAKMLAHTDLPLTIDVPQPERVGMDRLLNALAASVLRPAGAPAVVVSVGTAITVDLVSAQGSFAGGAILPGLDTSARALHEFTYLLPLVEVTEPEDHPGRSTVEAIRFGLHWGAVGAVRELIHRLVGDRSDAQVFLTGGGAPSLLPHLLEEDRSPLEFVPHLTLAGIALAAQAAAKKGSS